MITFRLDIRNNFFSQRVVMQWHNCPTRWWGHHAWRCYRTCGDVALRDVVSGHRWGGMIDLMVLMVLMVFSNFSDSMIL